MVILISSSAVLYLNMGRPIVPVFFIFGISSYWDTNLVPWLRLPGLSGLIVWPSVKGNTGYLSDALSFWYMLGHGRNESQAWLTDCVTTSFASTKKGLNLPYGKKLSVCPGLKLRPKAYVTDAISTCTDDVLTIFWFPSLVGHLRTPFYTLVRNLDLLWIAALALAVCIILSSSSGVFDRKDDEIYFWLSNVATLSFFASRQSDVVSPLWE